MQSPSKWRHKDGAGKAAQETRTDSMPARTLCDQDHPSSAQLQAAQQDAHVPGSIMGSTTVVPGNAPARIASSSGSALGVSASTPDCAQIIPAHEGGITTPVQCLSAFFLHVR